MAEKTLTDVLAKKNKDLSYEERCEKFKDKIRPICEEYGIIPWAKLMYTTELITSAPDLKDLWDSGNA